MRRSSLAILVMTAMLPLAVACEGEPSPGPKPVDPVRTPDLGPVLTESFRLIESRRTGPARVRLRRHLESHPGDGKAYFLFGLSYHREKRYGSARPWLERAVELDEGYPPAWHFLGWCLYWLGEPAMGRAALQRHLLLDPDEGDTHFALGLIDLEEDRLDEAEVHFQRAITLQADRPGRRREVAKCHARLGGIHLRRGDLDRARAALERATDLHEQHYEAFYMLSLVLRRLDEDEAAVLAHARFLEAARARAAHRAAERPVVVALAFEPEVVPASEASLETRPGPWFEALGAVTGLDLITTCGSSRPTTLLESNGGGLALVDYDGDGDLDLFVANGATLEAPRRGPGSRLYRNESTAGSIRFEDVTDAAGIDLRRWATSATAGDVDGDGFDDLYVTCWGPNVLLRNRGDGTFEDVTGHAGVGDDGWGTSAAMGDVDGDGDLDLYVVNYLHYDPSRPPPPGRFKSVVVPAGPRGLTPQHDVLYENQGDGTFEDVTEAWGCRPVTAAYGLNAAILDFDGDRRMDILVANDSMMNFLWTHADADAPRRLVDTGLTSGIAANLDGGEQASMGIAIADVDGDARPDVFTSNFSSDTNTLHCNADGVFFDDRTVSWGLAIVSRRFLGWSCAFMDFDLDGDEDLLVVNGHVYPQATVETMDSTFEQPPLLFERAGARFERVEPSGWLSEPHRDRAAVFGDLDLDGDVDVVVAEQSGPLRVLRNLAETTDTGRRGVVVALRDERTGAGNPRGLGGRVVVRFGDEQHSRWILCGAGYQSSSAPEAYLAVPEAVERVAIEVTWPDGHVQVDCCVPVRSRITVCRR